MATYDFLSTGGISVGPTTQSDISVSNSVGGFKCLYDKKSAISHGQFVIPSNKALFSDVKKGAFVAAITICRQNLHDKIKPVQGQKVYNNKPTETGPYTYANVGHGGSYVLPSHAKYGISHVGVSGGQGTSGDAECNSVLYEDGHDGAFLDSSANIEYDFIPVFDGTFYLENASSSGIPTGNSECTILGWVRVNKANSDIKAMFGYGSDSGHVEASYNSGVVSINLGSSNIDVFEIDTDYWFLVALVYDGNNFTSQGWQGSVSSLQVTPVTLGSTVNEIRFGLGIGEFESLTENLFIGNMRGFGIWPRVLSYDDISSYYYAGRVGYPDLPSRLKQTQVTEVSNAQTQRRVFSELYARKITIDTLDSKVASTVESASFDGSSRITISSCPTNVNSISLWVRPTSGSRAIITKGEDDWNSGLWDWAIWQDSGTSFYVNVIGGGAFTSYAFTPDIWYHLMIIRDNGSGNCEFYVNNTLIGTGASSSANDFSNTIYIGGTSTSYFDSNIAEVQLYNRALSSEERLDLYNNGLGSDLYYFGLIGGYHLNGNANDSSVGNNGVWSGTESYGQGYGGVIEAIQTSSLLDIETLTTLSLDAFETSGGSTLEVSSLIIEDLFTSTGAHLQFGSLTTEAALPVSFWDLTELSGTRFDSVSENHLDQVDIVVSFTCSTDVGRGNSVTFTDTSPIATDWLWDFGDDNSSTSQNPTHTYNSNGTYTVTLQIDGGLSVSHVITVHEPVASFTTNSPQDLGTAITFTDTSTYAVSWLWDFGDGSGTSTEQSPTYTYVTAGDYTVTLEINGDISNTANSVTVNESIIEISTPINLSGVFNIIGLVPADHVGENGSGIDYPAGSGTSAINQDVLFSHYSEYTIVDGIEFHLQSGNVNNIINCAGQTIPFSGHYDSIYLLGLAINGGTGDVPFTVNYDDETSTTQTKDMSDWFHYYGYEGETIALGGSNNLVRSDNLGPIYIYKYKLTVDRTKNISSISLPNDYVVFVLSISAANTISKMTSWVKADAIVGLSNDASVSTWADQSGNENDFIQTDDVQPVYRTNAINGFPAVHFYGASIVGNSYTSGNWMHATVPASGNYSVISVVRQTSPTGYFKVAVSWGGNGGGNTFWCGYIPDDSGQSYPGAFIPASDSEDDIYASPVDDTNWHIGEGIFNGTHLSGWSSSIPATASGVGASGNHNGSSQHLSGTRATLGCYQNNSLYWDGDIAEVMFFSVALTEYERVSIENYLINKYDLGNKNEVQHITFDQTPIGGTFTITVNGQTTGALPYNADVSTIQSYINGALGQNATSVS